MQDLQWLQLRCKKRQRSVQFPRIDLAEAVDILRDNRPKHAYAVGIMGSEDRHIRTDAALVKWRDGRHASEMIKQEFDHVAEAIGRIETTS
ncbi:hypothetical protein [Rhizobium viscosum]|uniref:Uncharacterized protein n=1 Tax=Rhizobium viscosum TaxID=1673 RepID=A0ABR9J176_RHIVS|nr:hypothetical protein [Rhizobium viscosum]MBE1509205.1 hypothetical protein [Rhizobium viscosum]